MNDFNEFENKNNSETENMNDPQPIDRAEPVGEETPVPETPVGETHEEIQSGVPVEFSAERSEEQKADGEYRFIPEKQNAWSDAGYTPSGSASTMPRSYHCEPPAEKKPQRSGKAKKAAGIIAACLACAIIGGVAGYAAPKLFEGGSQSAAVETVSTRDTTVLNMAAPAATPQISNAIVTGGQEMSATDIYYNLALNQVVGITTEITYTNVWGYTTSGAVKGSGFVLSADGYIMTNYHVIEDAVKGGYDIQVLMHDGTKYIASVVGYAEDNDVAVLKIDATGLSPVTIGDSDATLVGEDVYVVGNPLGQLEYSISEGIVSAKDRDIKSSDNGRVTSITMLQLTAPINSGNSGGPIYNSRGEVIGIATAKYASSGVEGLGFAIPIKDAVSIAQDLITDGYVRGRAYIGILKASTLSASSAQYYGIVPGVYFEGIQEGSAAEKAGLQVGDIIVGLGDTEIANTDQLTSALKDFHAGDTTTLKVYRNSEYVDLTITFDEAVPTSTDSSAAQNNQQQQQQQTPQYGNGYYDYFYDFFNGNPFGR